MHVAISGGISRIGLWQSGEGVSNKDAARVAAIGHQNSAHQNASPASPDAGFYEVAGDCLVEDDFRQLTQVMQALKANHCMRHCRPITAFLSHRLVVRAGSPWFDRLIAIYGPNQNPFHQIEVETTDAFNTALSLWSSRQNPSE